MYLQVPQGYYTIEKDQIDNKYLFSNCEPKYNLDSSFEGNFYSQPLHSTQYSNTNSKACNKYPNSAPKDHRNKPTQKCPASILNMKTPSYFESVVGFHSLSPYKTKASKINPSAKSQSSASRNQNPLLKLKEGSLFRTRELPVSSDDYTTVLKAFYNNERPSGNFKVEIHEIGFRNREQLRAQHGYAQHAREQQERLRFARSVGTPNMLVFHGTKGCNVPGILQKGFRASTQGDSVGDYGPGVYTTNFGSYAEQYCYYDRVHYVFAGEVINCHEMSIRNLDDRRLHRINKSAGMTFKGFEKITGHNTTGFDPKILKASDRS